MKPEKLLERIILATTDEEDVVMEPFMGSGTTCVVAKRLGRKYVGIEKEKQYYELSKRRINSV
ncbi:site-specific DNA-methyltransferase [Mycoplasmatota bacterium]|nr:site-specific DNA-methyltransferase [Mycoplasmatota bacterium]